MTTALQGNLSEYWLAPDSIGAASSTLTEQALRAERDFIAAVLDTAATLVVVVDAQGLPLYFSGACERATGYSTSEMRSTAGWASLFVPEEIPGLQRHFEDLCAGRGSNKHENRWVAKDGSHLVIEWLNAVVTGPSGDVRYIVGTGTDVTEKRLAEEALRQSERRFRAIIDQAPAVIQVLDEDDRLLLVNRQWETVVAMERDEVVGKSISELFPPEVAEMFRRHNQHVRDTGKPIQIELDVPSPSGTRTFVSLKFPLFEPGDVARPIGGISTDITERKALEEQLRHSQRMEAVGRLAGGVAHDFNNLLTVIGGYSELILKKLRPGDPLRPDVEEVVGAARRAAALTRQLLAFSRKQVLQPQVVDLNETVRSLQRMLERLVGEDLEIVTELDPALGRVRVDPGQIEQVIANLTVNAHDAMPNGGRLVVATRNESCSQQAEGAAGAGEQGDCVVLEVRDTGTGMDPETLSHIFEPFYTTKEVGKGTGLGLSTVHGIVAQSGGSIRAKSTPGCGATFTVSLPRVEEPLGVGAVAVDDDEGLRGSETVLVVEDQADVRRLASRALEQLGYRVLVAENGVEALLLCELHAEKIDLVLTDVVMPKMSGPQLVARLATLLPGLRALYMSGYPEDTVVRNGVLEGSLAFINKPFSPRELGRKVRRHLDAHGSSAS